MGQRRNVPECGDSCGKASRNDSDSKEENEILQPPIESQMKQMEMFKMNGSPIFWLAHQVSTEVP